MIIENLEEWTAFRYAHPVIDEIRKIFLANDESLNIEFIFYKESLKIIKKGDFWDLKYGQFHFQSNVILETGERKYRFKNFKKFSMNEIKDLKFIFQEFPLDTIKKIEEITG